jgi:hypothetical protein
MALSNTERLVNSGMVPGVAKEVTAQIADAGGLTPAAAITSLTGTVGTANDAMTAVPAATAPADNTATGLASLTSTNAAITAINNDLADLQAKVNAILAALRTTGVINT